MLKPLPTFPREVQIVPNAGITFLDFGLDQQAREVRQLRRHFYEEPDRETITEDGRTRVILHCPVEDAESGDLVLPGGERRIAAEDGYNVAGPQALAVFAGRWTPLPILRFAGDDDHTASRHLEGPSNWARVYVARLPEPDVDGHSHRLVIALDTRLEEQRPGQPYLAPTPRDAADQQLFGLVADPGELHWFLAQRWLDHWVEDVYRASRPPRRARADDEEQEWACEHWAHYLTFLAVLREAVEVPTMRLVRPTQSAVDRAGERGLVDVHLVLDVGNSRTCGILIEHNGRGELDLNNSYTLELRDLGLPHQVYQEPFTSQVEFARARLGMDHHSSLSGRAAAFDWPSLVRVGPEATRLRSGLEGTEGSTGLSSPKRYLWDDRPALHEWRTNGTDPQTGLRFTEVYSNAFDYLTEEGEVISALRGGRRHNALPALRARFSRSALFTFMLHEILLQALAQINSPGNRGRRAERSLPRRLTQIVMTLPPGMPLPEQKVFRERLSAAVKLTWDCLGWSGSPLAINQPPGVEVPCDEATATQLVYLYAEICDHLQTTARDLLEIRGRRRDLGSGLEPTLRLASIDIGGGTTDLMITTYRVEHDKVLRARQDFRETFRIAGDDILRKVIERHVVARIEEALRDRLPDGRSEAARVLLTDLLGGNRADEAEQQRQRRRQFVAQVLVPIGLGLLAAAEEVAGQAAAAVPERLFASFFAADACPSEDVLAYLETPAQREGAHDFGLEAVTFPIDTDQIALSVRAEIGEVLADLCELVHVFDCDVLLLSGRPSRLPVIRQLVVAAMPVTPDRIVPMYRYRAGRWYPFRRMARIEDPKTTAAVGAMICHTAEGRREDFGMKKSDFDMRSTARYIGVLERIGRIPDRALLFSDLDLDERPGGEAPEAKVIFYGPMLIGYRQLPLERWPAMPLYHLDYGNPRAARRFSLPFSLTLVRAHDEAVGEQEGDAAELEVKREEFEIREIQDANGDSMHPRDVQLQLRTLRDADGYWLDTGAVYDA